MHAFFLLKLQHNNSVVSKAFFLFRTIQTRLTDTFDGKLFMSRTFVLYSLVVKLFSPFNQNLLLSSTYLLYSVLVNIRRVRFERRVMAHAVNNKTHFLFYC